MLGRDLRALLVVEDRPRRQADLLDEVLRRLPVAGGVGSVDVLYLFFGQPHRDNLLDERNAQRLLERQNDDEIRDMYAVIPPLHRLRHNLDADVVVDRRRRNELLILELGREIVQILAQQHRDLLHIQAKIGDLLPAREPEIVQILLPAAQLSCHKRIIVCHVYHLTDRIITHPADFTSSNCSFTH